MSTNKIVTWSDGREGGGMVTVRGEGWGEGGSIILLLQLKASSMAMHTVTYMQPSSIPPCGRDKISFPTDVPFERDSHTLCVCVSNPVIAVSLHMYVCGSVDSQIIVVYILVDMRSLTCKIWFLTIEHSNWQIMELVTDALATCKPLRCFCI